MDEYDKVQLPSLGTQGVFDSDFNYANLGIWFSVIHWCTYICPQFWETACHFICTITAEKNLQLQ